MIRALLGLCCERKSDSLPPLCDSQPASKRNSIILRKPRAAGWPPRSGNWRASSRRRKRRSISGAAWRKFMAASPKKSLALDTNLLLDLAGEKDFAHEFKEEFSREFGSSDNVAGFTVVEGGVRIRRAAQSRTRDNGHHRRWPARESPNRLAPPRGRL